jgi:hypothetical protein
MSALLPNGATAASVQLDYRRNEKSRKRQLIRRSLCAIILAAIITFTVCYRQWLMSFPRGWVAAYWRDQCASYLAPAQQVVYDEDAARVAELVRSGDFAQNTAWSRFTYAWRRIRPLEHYLSIPQGADKAWYAGLVANQPVLYCHEAQRPDGTKVLMLIIYVNESGASARSFFRVMLCDRRKLLDDSQVAQSWDGFVFRAHTSTATTRPVRFFAGEPVPNDPCSCRISYQLADEWGEYTFTLQADDLILRSRRGPAP